MDISAAHLRALRAALFTALCVTLSAGSHVLLSRMPLPLSTVAALCAAVFALAYALAGRERGYWRIAALLLPLELAADLVFSLGQHTCYGAAGGPVAGPLRSLGVDLLCGGGSVGAPFLRLTDEAPAPASAWLLLLAAHLAVGLLAAGWLRRGEAALAQLLDAVCAVAFRPLLIAVAVVGATAAPRRPVPASVRTGPRARAVPLLVHCVVRRGPPCALAA
ncbi:hypothetical protein HEK616_14340 [Streptomyces nigrescens]|uniref:Integral membrane protein n=3 Tax=Streptomyces TaxID=1883 RepID=A0ABY6PE07_9ACTN|nr:MULTISPECIES: hypothetical protein [Streptomyces]MEE4423981.1 hypothetical protein [Streptomyces sp. DSM 41528]UZJ31802.1 hypothetical protein OJ254_17780 [Streptomyces endophytica]BDM67947.1 hypothetical protein HEK616_14340 [Streptomyces nigrescens]